MQSHEQDLPAGCGLCNVYEHEVPIAEYVMMAMLMHATRIQQYAASFREGRWDGNGRLGGETHSELFGKTVGIIGFGHIGQAVAFRARAFGLRVFAIDGMAPPPAGPTKPDWFGGLLDLPALLTSSDFIVVACPLNESSRGMIGKKELELIRPSGLLVAVSRAEVVEEAALFEALREGRIAAALDVWYEYPARPDQVMNGSRLPFHELPNVLATPHLSAWTGAMVERRMIKIAENLDRLAAGEPLDRVVLIGTWKQQSEETAMLPGSLQR
jgi:phosphoglycerate dehydrogenase-like enzyme